LAEVKFAGSGPASTIIGATLAPAVIGLTVTDAVPDFVASCVDVAVTVTVVGEETMGAVRTPDAEIEPAVALQVTDELKLPVPVTVAEHWLVLPDETVDGKQLTLTAVIDPIGLTVTDAVPDFVASWVEVAVTVTVVAEETVGAVSSPVEEIVALLLAVQVTAELKFPVPVTVAEHWLV